MTKRNSAYSFGFGEKAPGGGFVWRDAFLKGKAGRPFPCRLLVAANPSGGWGAIEIKDTLFADFASLKPTESAVLEFANRTCFLGRLNHGHPISAVAYPPINYDEGDHRTILGRPESIGKFQLTDDPQFAGELLVDWAEEILRMRRTINLAAALNGRKWDDLERWIRIDPPWVKYVDPDRYDGESAGVIADVLAVDVEKGQLSKAGRRLLREMINSTLFDITRIGIEFEDRQPQQKIMATSLLAIMWLQLLNSVAEGRISLCEVCPNLLIGLPGSDGKLRSNRKTCSNACRQKLSRMRRAKTQASLRR